MKMKIKFIKILMCVYIAVFGGVVESFAFDDDDAAAYLWKLINEARARPVAAIDAYYIDPEEARDALGADGWILELENGLPPLAWHGMLAASSADHNRDMIERSYYNYTSPEGIGVHDRITAKGYDPLVTDEALGILYFYLYVEPMEAVEGIFENMLRDELNPGLDYPKNIFGKNFTELGISFISTQLSFEEKIFNAYIVTIDFARPVEKRSYLLGNVYSHTEYDQAYYIDGVGELFVAEDDFAGRLLHHNGWSPEKANDDFKMVLEIINEHWIVDIPRSALSGYQIQMPVDTYDVYYSLNLLRGVENNLLKRVVDVGRNVNLNIDFAVD